MLSLPHSSTRMFKQYIPPINNNNFTSNKHINHLLQGIQGLVLTNLVVDVNKSFGLNLWLHFCTMEGGWRRLVDLCSYQRYRHSGGSGSGGWWRLKLKTDEEITKHHEHTEGMRVKEDGCEIMAPSPWWIDVPTWWEQLISLSSAADNGDSKIMSEHSWGANDRLVENTRPVAMEPYLTLVLLLQLIKCLFFFLF